MNLAGIIGPALGGLLIPLVGVSTIFTLNAAAFVLVLIAVKAWRRTKVAVDAPLEGFFDSLSGAVRYMRYAPGVRIVLLRNLIFGVLIGAIPVRLDSSPAGKRSLVMFVCPARSLRSKAEAIILSR